MTPHLHLRLFSFLVTLPLLAGSVRAQISAGQAFMQGQYVEVGINQCGVYGGQAAPLGALGPGPLGPWHPNVGAGLGFVADPDLDGWITGFPNRCGDYFVPGAPEESWAIQVGGPGTTVYKNASLTCSSSMIPGAVSGYTDFGTRREVVWEGAVTGGGLNLGVRQTTIMPVDKLYFVTYVLIRNDGAATVNDIYYGRSVDPDNEQPTSGSFTTTNTVLEQPPVNDDALVGATGLDFGCFLGLGARDPDARAAIGDAGTTFAMTSPYDIWNDGPGYSTVLGATVTQDWSISLAFYIDELLPGECVVKSFAYVLDTADLDEALAATASIPILADGVFVPDTSFVNYCVGDSVELEILGDSTATWVWTPALGLSIDTGRTVLAAPSVPTTYTVLGYRECDTLERELTIIPIDPDGFADAGPDLTICAGDTIALQGVDVPLGTTWNPGVNLADPTDPMTLAWPPVTTQYVISAETGALCPSLDTMILTVIQPPVLDATPDTIVCAGSSIQLEASNAVTYQWTPVDYLDNAGIANPVSTPDATVTYAVEGVDGFGCVGYDTTTITVLPLPAVDVGPDWIIDLVQDEFALLNGVAPTAASFSWDPVTGLDDPGSLTPSAQPELPTTYILTVTDANGCVNSDTVFVDVLNEFSVILPDAFTPNGDGLNDVWRPVTIGLIEFVDVSIYNRWGERLYFSRERSAGWDGTFMGKAQEMGSYIAVVRIRDPKGQPIQTTGTVTLIR